MKLIATHPILYQSTQYQIGQELPANNQDMVEAWINARTAAWSDGKEAVAVKSKQVTATVGLTGKAAGGEHTEENLVGKIPKTPARSKGGSKNG